MRSVTVPLDFADMAPDEVLNRIENAVPMGKAIRATPYRWADPSSLATRQWLLGSWLLKGEVTALVAPGGTGKSTISNTIALCLASGKPLLGQPLPRGPQAVWVFNLEDGMEELERQMGAACAFHEIGPGGCGDRLHVDSGLAQPLCTAIEDRDGFRLAEDVFEQLAATIRHRQIATVIVDPFVSSHAVRESGNEAIDAIAKRWKRLAQETGCAVVLVHHTKKLGGREVTAEDGRGAVALRDAARVVLTLNAMGQGEALKLGVVEPSLRNSLVRVDTGKTNRAPPGATTWIKLESQCLDNGGDDEAPDFVGVARLWEKPDAFEGLTNQQLHEMQTRVRDGRWRASVQAYDWIGNVIAEIMGLSAKAEKTRVQAVFQMCLDLGYLKIERHPDGKGNHRPFVVAGKLVEAAEL